MRDLNCENINTIMKSSHCPIIEKFQNRFNFAGPTTHRPKTDFETLNSVGTVNRRLRKKRGNLHVKGELTGLIPTR